MLSACNVRIAFFLELIITKLKQSVLVGSVFHVGIIKFVVQFSSVFVRITFVMATITSEWFLNKQEDD